MHLANSTKVGYMTVDFLEFLRGELDHLKQIGLYLEKRILHGTQSNRVQLDGKSMLMLCSNNYLGLANHPIVKAAAKSAIDQYGVGLGCGRSICSMAIQEELEEKIAAFKILKPLSRFKRGMIRIWLLFGH